MQLCLMLLCKYVFSSGGDNSDKRSLGPAKYDGSRFGDRRGSLANRTRLASQRDQ